MRATRPSVLSIVALVAVAVLLAISVSACTVQIAPTPNIEEIAKAVAGTWAAQTAVAGGASTTPGATGIPGGGTPEPALLSTEPARATASATASPAPSATMTAPPAPVAQSAASSTPPPAPTTAPSATMSPTFSAPCPIVTNPELVAGWDRSALGCPVADAAVVWSAWQPFERGGMLWRDDTDSTYALTYAGGTDATRGAAEEGGAAWRWDNSFPEGRGLKPPEGLYEPVRGFGYAWNKFLGGPTGSLGWASQPERGFCATLQPFERGFVLRSTTAGPCKNGLFNMARDPSFAPLFLAVASDGQWRRY